MEAYCTANMPLSSSGKSVRLVFLEEKSFDCPRSCVKNEHKAVVRFVRRLPTLQTQEQAGQVGRTPWLNCKDSRGTQAGLSEGPGTAPAVQAQQVLPPGALLWTRQRFCPCSDGVLIVPPPGSSEGPAPWGQVSAPLGGPGTGPRPSSKREACPPQLHSLGGGSPAVP